MRSRVGLLIRTSVRRCSGRYWKEKSERLCPGGRPSRECASWPSVCSTWPLESEIRPGFVTELSPSALSLELPIPYISRKVQLKDFHRTHRLYIHCECETS